MTPELTVLEGTPRDFVCPWCADRFVLRSDLDDHWDKSPRCKSNRFASNQLQTKYGAATGVQSVPGSPTLNLIRAEGCEHPEELRESFYRDMYPQPGDQPLGYRCGWCYAEVPTSVAYIIPEGRND